jgi:hypothetical protein
MRWVEHVACMGQMRNAYKMYEMLVTMSEGKRPLRLPRHRWENYIKTNLKETRYESVCWI